MKRREFSKILGAASAATVLAPSFAMGSLNSKKRKVVLVGTGIRGNSFWGKQIIDAFSDLVEFVGLCDINESRLKYAQKYIGVNCPLYSNFDKMLDETKPDLVMVTTVDATHDEFIIKSLKRNIDVLTEKPMTTDEYKCDAIMKAERASKAKIIVGFNYRWSPYMTKIKELLAANTIGKITSVDFHWYLNTYHGASYFRRWHGQMNKSGSLWIHKATHHFDLLNWWLDSDPSEVFAMGALEHYGKNGPFRGENCRKCAHTKECKFYLDITNDKTLMDLYVAHEHVDGYIRDNCLFREEIDIYDKMSAQIKYANNAVVNYSLTTYSPFEGWRIAFNGIDGRIEAWLDIPYQKNDELDQEALHKLEMSQDASDFMVHEPVIVHKLWNSHETQLVSYDRRGHGGGDARLQAKIFKNPEAPDPFKHSAGSRDGALSVLIGVAARRSIEQNKLIKIADLTDIKISPNRES